MSVIGEVERERELKRAKIGTGKPVFLKSSPVFSHRPAKRKQRIKNRKINQLRKNHLRKRREKLQTNSRKPKKRNCKRSLRLFPGNLLQHNFLVQ